MKIILILSAIIVAYFFLKRNKQSREIIKDTNDMVMCVVRFHVLEKNYVVLKVKLINVQI